MAKIFSYTTMLLLLIVTLFYTGITRFNYPSDSKFPIKGIDVSHHQMDIDWKKVKEQKIEFAFIKATEGGDFKDPNFTKNWNEARKYKIDVGAYHFFTFCKSGELQARNFMQTVPAETNALPPIIDLEYGGNCVLTKSKTYIIQEIHKIEKLLHQKYDKKPVFYVTREFYEDILKGNFLNNPIWFRSIFHKPKISDGRPWLFWQYGNRGHLKGINTYVDLNVFNGNVIEYKNWIKSN